MSKTSDAVSFVPAVLMPAFSTRFGIDGTDFTATRLSRATGLRNRSVSRSSSKASWIFLPETPTFFSALDLEPVSASDWKSGHAALFVGSSAVISDYAQFFNQAQPDTEALPPSAQSIINLELDDELRTAMLNRTCALTGLNRIQKKFVSRLANVMFVNSTIEQESVLLLEVLVDAIDIFEAPEILACFINLNLPILRKGSDKKEVLEANPDWAFLSLDNIVFFFTEVKTGKQLGLARKTGFLKVEAQAIAEAFAVANYNWSESSDLATENQEIRFCIQLGVLFRFYKIEISHRFLHDYVLTWTEPPPEEKLCLYKFEKQFLNLEIAEERGKILAALLHQINPGWKCRPPEALANKEE